MDRCWPPAVRTLQRKSTPAAATEARHPDRIDAEPGALVREVADKLRAMGHTVGAALRSQGDVHAVAVEPKTGMRLGWSDGRRGGKAIGY